MGNRLRENFDLRKFVLAAVKSELGHIKLTKPIKHGNSLLEITDISLNGNIDYIYNSTKGSSNVKDINIDIIEKIIIEIGEKRYL